MQSPLDSWEERQNSWNDGSNGLRRQLREPEDDCGHRKDGSQSQAGPLPAPASAPHDARGRAMDLGQSSVGGIGTASSGVWRRRCRRRYWLAKRRRTGTSRRNA